MVEPPLGGDRKQRTGRVASAAAREARGCPAKQRRRSGGTRRYRVSSPARPDRFVAGAISSEDSRVTAILVFNPRLPRPGAISRELRQTLPGRQVSIRAPSRGRSRIPRRKRQRSCFNPRPLAGAISRRGAAAPDDHAFQSAPPRGGDPGRTVDVGPRLVVSIRAPSRGRSPLPRCVVLVQPVSIRAPSRGRSSCAREPQGGTDGFNPRPLAGAILDCGSCVGLGLEVSIRAPSRGRSRVHRARSANCRVSIRAPSRGRSPTPGPPIVQVEVSIRAPSRGRSGGGSAFRLAFTVSIRAPSRGRSARSRPSRRGNPRFNPRPLAGAIEPLADRPLFRLEFQSAPPRGGDRVIGCSAQMPRMFQSAPPRGGDPRSRGTTSPTSSFNPRPLAGAIVARPPSEVRDSVSIRAPSRGRSPERERLRLIEAVSIRAPSRGRSRRLGAVVRVVPVSIRAPSRGRSAATPSTWRS